jgi:hypothetical protein
VTDQSKLPFDCSRCLGLITLHYIGETKTCDSRENCKRYLSRDRVGERTPWVNPSADTSEICGYFWKS